MKSLIERFPPITKGPFTIHEEYDEAYPECCFVIRHGFTPQARGRYWLHGIATIDAWNTRNIQSH